MSDILSDEEFEELAKTTAKMRQITVAEAKLFLIERGARTAGAADAEKTTALGPAKSEQ